MIAVLPADVDDPTRPSGGNLYDRRLLTSWPAAPPLPTPQSCTSAVRVGHHRAASPPPPTPESRTSRARVGHADGERPTEILAAGGWPYPSAADLAALGAALAAVPRGETVLLDGLVACASPSVVVPEAARLRLVVLVHLPLGDEAGADPVLVHREREVLHAAAAVVATSGWSARRIAEVHGLERVCVVRPGTDPAPVASGSGGGGLLCVGSITPTKGQDVLVRALARIADREWRCSLVGPVDRSPAHVTLVRTLVADHGLAGRVSLTGPLTGAALDEAYAAADLLVLPSRAESFGMVLVEALARGIPVVASEVGGVREAVGGTPPDGVPGLLVPPDDPAALAAALAALLDDPHRRASLRRAALARRDTLSTWPDAAAEMCEVLA
ncbi:glycosyltransferase [Pseudonocardia xishanensis]|uniref:Glycosyltransferase family 4 protein n=1 Tax=Pseudonocardia xishanensis TaxID=630995 RepID=A0ABP8RSB8_9PSEU